MLATSEELARIGDVHNVALRTVMDATKQRIAQRLAQETFDAVLVIAHGGPGYVLLNDGPMDPQWLSAQLASHAISVAVIATCLSAQRPEAKHATAGFADVLPAAGINTVTMLTEVSDRSALEYDVAFFQILASGSSVRAAHQAGVAAAALHGGVRAAQLTPRDDGEWYSSGISLMNADKLETKVDQLLDNMHELDKRISRLEDRMGRLEMDMTQLRHHFQHAPSPLYSKGYLIGIAAAMTVMIILLTILTWRLLV